MTRVKMVVLIGLAALGAVYAGNRPEDMTREEKNKLLVDVAVSAMNHRDWENMKKLYSPKYVQHGPGNRERIEWPEFEKNCREAQKALPNLRYKIEDIIAEGDKVVVRLSSCSTSKEKRPEGYSVGRKIEMTEIDIFRIEGGRIIEAWIEYDVENLRKQLGHLGYGGTSPEDAAKEYMNQLSYIEDFTDALIKEMDKRPSIR